MFHSSYCREHESDVRIRRKPSGADIAVYGWAIIGPLPAANFRMADDTPGFTSRHIGGWAFQGQVDCLPPGYNGFRAVFQEETKRRADEAQPGKVRRGP